jgi:8-oxo-dGTP pyrophosphatase MutT (NUDIX family)
VDQEEESSQHYWGVLENQVLSFLYKLDPGLGPTGGPIAFRTKLRDIGRVPKRFLDPLLQEGTTTGFKGFATPAQQRIISFRAEQQDPTKALISTRFELFGIGKETFGEIEAIGRAGAVFRRTRQPRFFSRKDGQRFLIEEVQPTGRVVEPQDLIKRARGTAIIKTPKGILLTFAPEERAFILPGGGIEPRESLARGTIREVFEETGLNIKDLKFLGQVTGPIKRFGVKRPGFRFVKEQFEVFETKVSGFPKGGLRPSTEVQKIAFLKPGSKLPITPTTREILKLSGRDFGGTVKLPKAPKVDFIPKSELKPGEFTLEDISRLSRVQATRESLISPRSFIAGEIGSRIPSRRKRRTTEIIPEIIPSGRRITRPITSIQLTPSRVFGRDFRRPTFGIPETPLAPEFDFPIEEFPIREKPTRRRKPKTKKKPKKIKGKRFRGTLRPSFTAVITDLRGALPKEIKLGKIELGTSPAQLRRIPARRGRR